MTSSATLYDSARARQAQGDLSGAAEMYRQAIGADPTNADALHMLGVTALQLSLPEAAVDAIEQALHHRPHFPEAWGNLGTALQNLGRVDGAETALRRAASEAPDIAAFHFNLGNLLATQQRVDDAEAAYRQAVRLQPRYPEAHSGLGTVLRDREDLAGATASFETAVKQKPGFAEAHYNLGNAYRDLGRLADAESEIRAALAVRPGYAKAYNTLGIILSDAGRSAEALSGFAVAMDHDPAYMPAASNWLSAQQYVPSTTEIALADAHALWADRYTHGIIANTAHGNTRDPNRLLTVGFISPDLGIHPAGLLSVRLFENLDPPKFIPSYSARGLKTGKTPSARASSLPPTGSAWTVCPTRIWRSLLSGRASISFSICPGILPPIACACSHGSRLPFRLVGLAMWGRRVCPRWIMCWRTMSRRRRTLSTTTRKASSACRVGIYLLRPAR